MRRTLGTLAIVLVLGGCGDGAGPTTSPPAQVPEVVLVSQTAGRGTVEDRATDVTARADLASYVAQLDDPLAAKVLRAARRLEGGTVLAQVVYVGCGAPSSAHLMGAVIVPAKVDDATKECLAPVTTVALAAVPQEGGE